MFRPQVPVIIVSTIVMFLSQTPIIIDSTILMFLSQAPVIIDYTFDVPPSHYWLDNCNVPSTSVRH